MFLWLCGPPLQDPFASSETGAGSNTPPVVTLSGPPSVTLAAGDTYAACGEGAPLSALCDRGASANDAEDGALTARVEVCAAAGAAPSRAYFFAQYGLSSCARAFPGNVTASGVWRVPGTFRVNFTVRDSAGAVGSATRTVVVLPNCPQGERPCASTPVCSVDGSCVSDLDAPPEPADSAAAAPAARAPPTIALITVPGVLGAEISVKRFSSAFRPCAPGFAPATSDVLCEPGAAASDAVDGDLTASVLACPPEACLAVGCPGHEFVKKGLEVRLSVVMFSSIPSVADES